MGFSKWISKKKKTKREDSGITLSDVIRGLQFCVNSSSEIMEQHYLTTVDKYIDANTQKPLAKRFHINDDYAMDVPLICLSDHHSLYIDELDVRLNVNLKDMDIKEATAPYQGDNKEFSVDRSSFLVELSNVTQDKKGNSNMDVKLKFKATEPPEALSRVLEKLDNAVMPVPIEKNDGLQKE